jgi:Rrf2 family nitric oxide-sensitive transcriptional repressor
VRLTRYTDNALRCLTLLGISDGTSITVAEISRRMNMSEDHLFKVVGRLSQLGYVETTRGRSGGVKLAKPAEGIIIGDVVRATEESMALVECFEQEGEIGCPIAPKCVLAGTLDRALAAFLAVLDGVTLADLVAERRGLEELLMA